MIDFNFQRKTSVQFSHSVVSNSSQPHGLQHTRLPCPSPTRGACSHSCPWSQWCHPNISSSVISFSSRFQSFPTSGFFQMSQLFASGGQSFGVSAPVLPKNVQGWFPLGWTGLISLLSKGLSRVFSNTTLKNFPVCCDPHSQRLWHNQEGRCFSGIFLLFWWSSGGWQFDLWFLCFF